VREATREIPLSRPWIDEREEELVLDVLRSGRLSLGPWIDRFEGLFSERLGVPSVAVSSGTAGLHLLTHYYGLGPGGEVITSPYSFVASANCFIYEGATPVFADIDARTLNLDPAAVEAAVSERTRAIVAVDIFGYPCEYDELADIAGRHGLTLIDDACQALGAEYKGKPVGARGPAVFAFYANKQITTAEGGMITLPSTEQLEVFRSLRNQGRADSGGWLEHTRLGFNYRMDDVSAALGIAQLDRLDEILELRSAAAARYEELLQPIEGVQTLYPDDADHRRSWFVYVVKLAAGIDREQVIAALEREGVASARYLPCIHLQPYMRERFAFAEGMCPVAEDTAARTLALPFYTQIEPGDQERVVAVLSAALA
jgi:perosamine synthetase